MDKSYGFEFDIVFEDGSDAWDYVFTTLEEDEHEVVLRCAENAIRQKLKHPDGLLLEFEDWSTPDMKDFKKGLVNCALWNFTGTMFDREHDLDNSTLYFYLPADIYKEAAAKMEEKNCEG